jgi:hypothetical protein
LFVAPIAYEVPFHLREPEPGFHRHKLFGNELPDLIRRHRLRQVNPAGRVADTITARQPQPAIELTLESRDTYSPKPQTAL